MLLVGYAAIAYVRLYEYGAPWTSYLPLHLCDLLLFPCLFALWRPRPLPFELTYYFGIAGAFPAMITPDLRQGFPSFAFLHFFWGHAALILTVVWLSAVEGQRPRPGAVVRMLAAGNLYVVVVGLINLAFGLNFGYLCHPPAGRSPLDFLGPWPWYLLSLEVLALGLFVLLDLPWRRQRAVSATSSAKSPGDPTDEVPLSVRG
jgi:hypothetical integral membrane protein (TIGR02206 family)